MDALDTPISTSVVRAVDGSYLVVCRAVFMVSEDADMSGVEAMVEEHAVRASHIVASDLVRDHLVAC